MLTPPMQGGLYYARRRRKANIVLRSLTPWRTGLVCTLGQYVSSENGTSAWKATASGTTGVTAPAGGQAANDGGVTWRRADLLSLLKFLFTGAPTP